MSNDAPTIVRVKALDAEGNVVKSYSGTANITSTDTATGAFGSGDRDLPEWRGNVPGHVRYAGSQTLTLTDSTTSTLTGSATTVVAAPDVATHFAVVLPKNVTAGQTLTVEIVALDAQNHIVQNYANTAAVIVDRHGGHLVAGHLTFQHGIASVQVTFATLGSRR